MKLLAIDSSFEACSVALRLDGETLQRFELAPREHASLLLPWTEKLLAEAGLALSALDAIAFSRGPGSFTSLRIGIGVVQGLAWGADLPVAPVSSLAVTAQVSGASKAVVAMDARMQEVYAGRFVREGGRVLAESEETVCPASKVAVWLQAGWTGVGNGFERFPELAAAAQGLEALKPDTWPTAAAVAELAEFWLQENPGLPAEQAQLVYIRDKVAEKPKLP